MDDKTRILFCIIYFISISAFLTSICLLSTIVSVSTKLNILDNRLSRLIRRHTRLFQNIIQIPINEEEEEVEYK